MKKNDRNMSKLSKYFSFLISHLSSSKGFTLIELLVVFGVIGILTSLGIASYSSYTRNQTVQIAAADIVNLMNTAKSRSISQVKPTQCAGQTLIGYQVGIIIPGPQYTLSVVCGTNTYILKTQDLPSGVTFATGSTSNVQFAVSRGTSSPATITLNGNGRTKTITVSATGIIATN